MTQRSNHKPILESCWYGETLRPTNFVRLTWYCQVDIKTLGWIGLISEELFNKNQIQYTSDKTIQNDSITSSVIKYTLLVINSFTIWGYLACIREIENQAVRSHHWAAVINVSSKVFQINQGSPTASRWWWEQLWPLHNFCGYVCMSFWYIYHIGKSHKSASEALILGLS